MEKVETLNQRLIDFYGIDSDTGRPSFRITWANDEREKRLVKITDSGIELMYPTVTEVKKYPFFKDMWVLERLVIIPDINAEELPTQKLSYEPLWTYCDQNHNPLPPHWGATKLVIDTLFAALGKKSMRKYVEDEKQTTKEGREQRITELQEELFGNETETGDALRYREGIVVPGRKDN